MKKIKINGTKEIFYTEKLSNGLEIYMLPNDNVNKFYITLNTRFGSLNTKFKYNKKEYNMPKGIAHYLEHLSFNMEEGSVFDYYSKIGSMINAFTTYDLTSYNVSSNNRFKENLEYLLEYVYTPYFNKELVNNERGVILEEINMYKDNPGSTIFNKTLNNLFIKDEHKYLVGGTSQDIKKIKLEDIETCYNAYYTPNNMFIIITGHFNPEQAVAIISEKMKKIKFQEPKEITSIYPKEPKQVLKPYEELEMNIDKPKISVGFKIPKNIFKSLKLEEQTTQMYIELILNANFGSTSLILEELQNGNITEDIDYTLMDTNEYYIILFLSSTYYPDYLKDKILDKFNNLEIYEEDIKRTSKVAISNYILMFDSIVSVNNFIIDDIMDNKEFSNGLIEKYRNLNEETSKQIINKLKNYNHTIFKIMPKTKDWKHSLFYFIIGLFLHS